MACHLPLPPVPRSSDKWPWAGLRNLEAGGPGDLPVCKVVGDPGPELGRLSSHLFQESVSELNKF